MFFLLSGEGVTDIGAARSDAPICEGEEFVVGPMTIIVAHIVEAHHGYSILAGACGFISEARLSQRAGDLKAVKKEIRIPGKKRERETHYFFNNARTLSRIAREKAAALGDDVVAILFRDSDGTGSADRGRWEDQWQSMLDGFQEEEFDNGVPMIPKPKSEAWLICAFKKRPYQACDVLEKRSGNDKSPNSLKRELATLIGPDVESERLVEKVKSALDIDRIKMPSFSAFRGRLEDVI